MTRNGIRDRKLKANVVLGLSDKNIVKLDFDNTLLAKVKEYAKITIEYFNLKGFIILRSSRNNYHVVFDRKVSWE